MFDRFTERARKVMSFARQASQQLCHDYIGTEHILLGLLQEGSGVAARVLKRLDVELRGIRREVEKIVKQGTNTAQLNQLPFTPRAKVALELALEASQNMGHNYIGTEHLLLGLIGENDGIAAQVLLTLGAKLEEVREEILELLGTEDPDDSDDAESPELRLARDASDTERSRTPVVDAFCRDLTALAKQGALAPFVGRARELERLCVVLSRYEGGNAVLVGRAGVGKRAIIEGLAQRIVAEQVPPVLLGRRLVTLDVTRVLAGAKYQGQLAERIAAVLVEVRRVGNVILHVADLHDFAGTDVSVGVRELANALRIALHRGELQGIAAMTPAEYRSQLEKDSALSRHFQVVRVDPMSEAETLEILTTCRVRLELHHRVRFEESALRLAVELAAARLTARPLPLSALDVLDDAGAHVVVTETPHDEGVAVDDAMIRAAIERLAAAEPGDDAT